MKTLMDTINYIDHNCGSKLVYIQAHAQLKENVSDIGRQGELLSRERHM